MDTPAGKKGLRLRTRQASNEKKALATGLKARSRPAAIRAGQSLPELFPPNAFSRRALPLRHRWPFLCGVSSCRAGRTSCTTRSVDVVVRIGPDGNRVIWPLQLLRVLACFLCPFFSARARCAVRACRKRPPIARGFGRIDKMSGERHEGNSKVPYGHNLGIFSRRLFIFFFFHVFCL